MTIYNDYVLPWTKSGYNELTSLKDQVSPECLVKIGMCWHSQDLVLKIMFVMVLKAYYLSYQIVHLM